MKKLRPGVMMNNCGGGNQHPGHNVSYPLLKEPAPSEASAKQVMSCEPENKLTIPKFFIPVTPWWISKERVSRKMEADAGRTLCPLQTFLLLETTRVCFILLVENNK